MGVDEKYIIDNIVTFQYMLRKSGFSYSLKNHVVKINYALKNYLIKQLNHSKYIFNRLYSIKINMYMMSQ